MQVFFETFPPAEENCPYLRQKQRRNEKLKTLYQLSDQQLNKARENYQIQSDFFSTSYTTNSVLLAISKKKIGVDLEFIKERDESLLKKYQQEIEKIWPLNRENFYTLRTAKESILKCSDSKSLDNIDKIELIAIKKNSQQHGELFFKREGAYHYEGKSFTTLSGSQFPYSYSICF